MKLSRGHMVKDEVAPRRSRLFLQLHYLCSDPGATLLGGYKFCLCVPLFHLLIDAILEGRKSFATNSSIIV